MALAEKWEKIARHPGVFRRRGRDGWRYRIWYRDADRKARTKDFGKLADAERFHSSVKRSTGAAPDVEAGRITVADFAAHVMATSPNLRPSTRAAYESQWRIDVLPRLGDLELGAREGGEWGDGPPSSFSMGCFRTIEARSSGPATEGNPRSGPGRACGLGRWL